jgi:hypothetical protein
MVAALQRQTHADAHVEARCHIRTRLGVRLAAFDLLAGRDALSPARRRQLCDEGCFFKLGDRSEHLAHQHGGRRVLDEVHVRAAMVEERLMLAFGLKLDQLEDEIAVAFARFAEGAQLVGLKPDPTGRLRCSGSDASATATRCNSTGSAARTALAGTVVTGNPRC